MKILKYIIFLFFFGQAKSQALFHSNNYCFCLACDADALSFITAAGITDATQKTAICDLVKGFKDSSIWSKMYAIYPMVGGTATTMKFNLKDSRDLDAAFRISWVAPSSILFSSTGFTPNFTGYADTRFAQSVNGIASSFSISFYSRTSMAGYDSYEMGAYGSGGNQLLAVKLASGSGYGAIDGGVATSVAISDTRGLFMVSRISTTSISYYRNGVSLNTQTASVASNPNAINTFIGYVNGLFSSTKECAFATIAQGLTATEARMLYNIIQAFQTSLGRAMP